LDDRIGGIAPGRFADIIIIPDLEHIRPEMVISNGRIVAQNGELTVLPRRHQYPCFVYSSIHLNREVQPQDFTVPVTTSKNTSQVRVIDQITHLLTREAIIELPVKDGLVQMNLAAGIIKVAAVERLYAPNQTFTGFIRGIGLNRGAIATSTTWDTGDILVVGASEPDMALAVNRIKELNGGLTVCLNGSVIGELAFPVGGMISTEPMEYLAQKLNQIQKLSRDMGCTSPDIRTTISILCTGAIPYLRICESGLFNLRTNGPVDLLVDEE
jgi:adenine deaminase